MSVKSLMAALGLMMSGLTLSSPLLAKDPGSPATPQTVEQAVVQPRVQMSTSMGDFIIELDPVRAPDTVANFLQYVDDGFYRDTLFHRVIEGFMIQGGGFSTQFQRKTTRPPIANEAFNGLRNDRYTIAMARTNAPHSATSQFFINTVDNHNLNYSSSSRRGWGYAVFGRVVQGQQVVDEISRVKTGSRHSFARDFPLDPIVINDVSRIAPPTASAAPVSQAGETTPDAAAIPAIPARPAADKDSGKLIQTEPVEQN